MPRLIRILSILPHVLGIISVRAEESFDVSGRPEGIIAFSSLSPRHWDLYTSKRNGETHVLTDSESLDYNAAFSPDGGRIAFVSERDGNVDLYSMASDGTEIRRLTRLQAMDDHPAWSPDSKQLVFVSTRKPAEAGRAWNALYVMDEDGRNVRPLSNGEAADYSPAWSPRGDLLAFSSGRSRPKDVYLMKPDGSERRLLIENGGWPTFIDNGETVVFHRKGDDEAWNLWQVGIDGTEAKLIIQNASMPRASADGSTLAYVKRDGEHAQIAVLDIASGETREVTTDPVAHWNPSLSPDGRTVVYHRSTPDGEKPNAIWWAAPAGTDLELLQVDGAFPAFSPDKSRVAFVSRSFSTIDVMTIDGSERTTIFEGTHRSLFGSSWSAAPERIAFSHGTVFAGAEAQVNIKSVNPDGTDLQSLTADAGNNGFPSFSPDGKQVLFRSGRDGSKNLYIMDRDGQNIRRLTNGEWTDTMCDWSPDGQWITFSSDRDENYEIWLIRPDGSGLRKLIGGGGRNNHPHFSPDGEWIVFTSQRAGHSAEPVSLPRQPQPYGDLFIIRTDGSGLTRLTHNGFEEGTPAWSLEPQ